MVSSSAITFVGCKQHKTVSNMIAMRKCVISLNFNLQPNEALIQNVVNSLGIIKILLARKIVSTRKSRHYISFSDIIILPALLSRISRLLCSLEDHCECTQTEECRGLQTINKPMRRNKQFCTPVQTSLSFDKANHSHMRRGPVTAL